MKRKDCISCKGDGDGPCGEMCDRCRGTGKEPSRPEDCKHTEFQADATVARLEESRNGGFQMDVRVKCLVCKAPFRFKGLPYGVDLNGAAVSADGTEARLAIEPCLKGVKS